MEIEVAIILLQVRFFFMTLPYFSYVRLETCNTFRTDFGLVSSAFYRKFLDHMYPF